MLYLCIWLGCQLAGSDNWKHCVLSFADVADVSVAPSLVCHSSSVSLVGDISWFSWKMLSCCWCQSLSELWAACLTGDDELVLGYTGTLESKEKVLRWNDPGKHQWENTVLLSALRIMGCCSLARKGRCEFPGSIPGSHLRPCLQHRDGVCLCYFVSGQKGGNFREVGYWAKGWCEAWAVARAVTGDKAPSEPGKIHTWTRTACLRGVESWGSA